VLGVLALLLAAFLGMRGKKGAASAAGLAGLGAMGGAAVGGVTAAKPAHVIDPRATRVLADPRAAQVRALGEAAARLEAAGPAIAQALLEASDDQLSPARQRAATWKRERTHLDDLSTELDQSLQVVGPLGTLSQSDGSESVERAQQILDRLTRDKRDRSLAAAAEAEVEALGQPAFGAERLRELDTERPMAAEREAQAKAAAARQKKPELG
jgi:hypothetical protein